MHSEGLIKIILYNRTELHWLRGLILSIYVGSYIVKKEISK